MRSRNTWVMTNLLLQLHLEHTWNLFGIFHIYSNYILNTTRQQCHIWKLVGTDLEYSKYSPAIFQVYVVATLYLSERMSVATLCLWFTTYLYMIAGTWCALCWVWNTDSCYSSNWNYYSHYSEHRHRCTPSRRSTSPHCHGSRWEPNGSSLACRPGRECLIIYQFSHKLSIQICIYRHLEKDALNYDSM